ncbi:hypothetical protein [Nocardia sp. XZ_19_231]|uniref:hypothetical protein n=1 Tax=Nocardia sp. XZ_19_231 TaxID=2769252 RepID=UPI00188EC3F3|nr:hypothetical protein [Nocardia sp. XZ_19_231]
MSNDPTMIQAQARILRGRALIALIQPVSVWSEDPVGNRVDVVEMFIRSHGGAPMGFPLVSLTPASGWQATLNVATDELSISSPGGSFYAGTMPTNDSWLKAFEFSAVAGDDDNILGVVEIVTGAFASVDDIDDKIATGRATHLCTTLLVSYG